MQLSDVCSERGEGLHLRLHARVREVQGACEETRIGLHTAQLAGQVPLSLVGWPVVQIDAPSCPPKHPSLQRIEGITHVARPVSRMQASAASSFRVLSGVSRRMRT